MKTKSIILFSLCFILSNSIFGQSYINESSQWYYTWEYFDIHRHSGIEKITITGEENINDTTYYSLEYFQVDSVFLFGSLEYVDTTSGFAGFIREENKKFHRRYSIEGNEFLFYDFNLEIGDTIPHNFIDDLADTTIVVTNIDTLHSGLGGLSRKRYFTNFNDIQLIEGVGNSRTWRMPEYYFEEGITDYGNNNICYSINGENILINENFDCLLDPTTSTTDLIDPFVKLSIFPNPFQESSILKIHQISSQTYDVLIFNSIGQLVFMEEGVVNSNYQLNRNHLISGVYFIQIKQEGKLIANGKFVISE